jgi:hypothetical protein
VTENAGSAADEAGYREGGKEPFTLVLRGQGWEIVGVHPDHALRGEPPPAPATSRSCPVPAAGPATWRPPMGVAADFLGHTDLGTTRKPYIQAKGLVAHTRIQGLIARRRSQAREPEA